MDQEIAVKEFLCQFFLEKTLSFFVIKANLRKLEKSLKNFFNLHFELFTLAIFSFEF